MTELSKDRFSLWRAVQVIIILILCSSLLSTKISLSSNKFSKITFTPVYETESFEDTLFDQSPLIGCPVIYVQIQIDIFLQLLKSSYQSLQNQSAFYLHLTDIPPPLKI